MNADARLDPEGEDLPWDRFEENRAMRDPSRARPQRRRRAPHRPDEPISFAPKHPVIEGIEARQREAAELAANEARSDDAPSIGPAPQMDHQDPTIGDSLGHLPDLRPRMEGDHSMLTHVKEGYLKDPLCTKVLNNIEHHKNFKVIDSLLYTHNRADENVLCVPPVIHAKHHLTKIVIA